MKRLIRFIYKLNHTYKKEIIVLRLFLIGVHKFGMENINEILNLNSKARIKKVNKGQILQRQGELTSMAFFVKGTSKKLFY